MQILIKLVNKRFDRYAMPIAPHYEYRPFFTVQNYDFVVPQESFWASITGFLRSVYPALSLMFSPACSHPTVQETQNIRMKNVLYAESYIVSFNGWSFVNARISSVAGTTWSGWRKPSECIWISLPLSKNISIRTTNPGPRTEQEPLSSFSRLFRPSFADHNNPESPDAGIVAFSVSLWYPDDHRK